MRKAFRISFLLISLATVAVATPQAPDKLIYEGQVYDLFSNPLESYYENDKVRPSFFVSPDPKYHLTGLMRGYVATWKIEEGILYLTEIDSWICEGERNDKCKRAVKEAEQRKNKQKNRNKWSNQNQ